MSTATRQGAPQKTSKRRLVKARDERTDNRSERILLGGLAIAIVLGTWELITALSVMPRILLPSPADVVVAFGQMFSSPTILADFAASGKEFVYGYLLATVTGVCLGILIGWYRRFGYLFDPFVNLLYAVPRVALSPLLIVWFGIGINSKIALVFLMVVFPVLINTATGVRSLDPQMLRVARCFNASDLQIFRTIALPGTVPFILGGLRLAVAQALIGVFVAELLGAQHGIGRLITDAGNQFKTATVFAGLIIFAVAGLVLTAAVRRMERHFDAWRA